MRLTKAGEYAIRCILYLSMQKKGVVASRNEIADAMDIPRDFLTKIAQQLSRAGIIEIVQGAWGGYRLLIAPEDLTLLTVVEAVIGEIYLNDCVRRPESCERSITCSVHRIWEEARDRLRETLRLYSFADILADDACTTELLEQLDLRN